MRKWRHRFSAVFCATAIAGTGGIAAGCGDDDNEGAVEDAGQAVEDAGEEAGQAAEEAGQEVEQGAENAEKEIEGNDD